MRTMPERLHQLQAAARCIEWAEKHTPEVEKVNTNKEGNMESKTLRRRVNVTRGMTGKISWECTVESDGPEQAEVLIYSDSLVAALNQRYPITPEPEKK